MHSKRYTLCFILTIILSNLIPVSSKCSLEDLPRDENKCAARLWCEAEVTYDDNDLTDWSCIKHTESVRNENYHQWSDYEEEEVEEYDIRTYYDENYDLIIHVTDVKVGPLLQLEPISGLNNIINHQHHHITKITITNSLLLDIEYAYVMDSVKEIDIFDNIIESSSINLYLQLIKVPNLDNLILRNNSILEIRENVGLVNPSNLKMLDLSINRLKQIPNNCFVIFPQLRTLNLSQNFIESLDILTFEGLSELTTLDVSHNNLYSIENSFAKFINLKYLYLENNHIEKIIDYNFVALVDVERINLSSNFIESIENNSFRSLKKLQYLNINNNKIKTLSKKLLLNNVNLDTLLLSDNNIDTIESNAFDGKNITKFKFEHNALKGHIEIGTFKGVYTDILNLSRGNITAVDDEAFGYMCDTLNELNFTDNKITYISYNAFSCLESLKSIDVSNNHLNEINFNMSSFKRLSKLYLRNNSIESIKVKSLKNVTALKNLDLSYNNIKKIESRSFSHLSFLESLLLSHNVIDDLEKSTFDGLLSMQSLDMTHTRVSTFKNKSFSGLESLTRLNSSHGQLSLIHYDSFSNTGSIKVLDLSHNLINVFYVNNSAIVDLEELFLNNNDIKYINQTTFSGLTSLQLLSLSNNNIMSLESNSFADLKALSCLFLSSNLEMDVLGKPFSETQSLNELSLDNVNVRFTFAKWNIYTAKLNLQSCRIRDINNLFVFDVKGVEILNLRENEITSIDKFSFQSMDSLIILDLSMNKISFIQPGSFLRTTRISILDMSKNNIETLHFGDFDGLTLRSLNLSNNAIQIIDAKLFNSVETLYLDNNVIMNINFEEFFESNLSKLSIGGNRISCKTLVNLKLSNFSEKYDSVVTTQYLDYHSENFNGISCESVSIDSNLPVLNNTNLNIKPFLDKLTSSIEKLRSSIEDNKIINDKQKESPKSDKELIDLINKLNEYINSSKEFINSSKTTQKIFEDYINKTEYYSNNVARKDFKNFEEHLINTISKINAFALNRTNYPINVDDKSIKNDIRTELEIMLKAEIKSLRDEFQRSLDNTKDSNSSESPQTFSGHNNNEIKLFYFISLCLLVIVVLYSVNIFLTYARNRQKQPRFQSSTNPLQMESLE